MGTSLNFTGYLINHTACTSQDLEDRGREDDQAEATDEPDEEEEPPRAPPLQQQEQVAAHQEWMQSALRQEMLRHEIGAISVCV